MALADLRLRDSDGVLEQVIHATNMGAVAELDEILLSAVDSLHANECAGQVDSDLSPHAVD